MMSLLFLLSRQAMTLLNNLKNIVRHMWEEKTTCSCQWVEVKMKQH